MRTFEHFPEDKICPICLSGEDRPCVLIVIHGTQEGYNAQAQPFHADCVEGAMDNLQYVPDIPAIYYRW